MFRYKIGKTLSWRCGNKITCGAFNKHDATACLANAKNCAIELFLVVGNVGFQVFLQRVVPVSNRVAYSEPLQLIKHRDHALPVLLYEGAAELEVGGGLGVDDVGEYERRQLLLLLGLPPAKFLGYHV
jgi:hypothetical protein